MTLGKQPKELHRLLKKIDRVSNGQAKISSWNPDSADKINVEVFPNDGIYKGGKFEFEIRMDEDFPETPPILRCLTPVYHPNIDPTNLSTHYSNICLDMFETDTWEKNYGLDGTIQGILFLFYHPNLDDPVSPFFDALETEETFKDDVKRSLRGDEIKGFLYPKNLYGEDENTLEKDDGKIKLIVDLVQSQDDNSVVKSANDERDANDEHEESTASTTEASCAIPDDAVKVDLVSNAIEDNMILQMNDRTSSEVKDVALQQFIEDVRTTEESVSDDQEMHNFDKNISTRSIFSENSNILNVRIRPANVHSVRWNRYCIRLYTFDRLSPEIDILLFVCSNIFSKHFRRFRSSCS